MKSELTYLLDELDNWSDDTPLIVQDLKKMINKSFKQASKDQDDIDNSMDEFGPFM